MEKLNLPLASEIVVSSRVDALLETKESFAPATAAPVWSETVPASVAGSAVAAGERVPDGDAVCGVGASGNTAISGASASCCCAEACLGKTLTATRARAQRTDRPAVRACLKVIVDRLHDPATARKSSSCECASPIGFIFKRSIDFLS